MGDIIMPFHAIPKENASLAKEIISRFGVYACAITFFPFRAAKVAPEELEAGICSAAFRAVAFTEREPTLPVAGQGDFAEKNPGALHLRLGQLTPKGLGESALMCRTLDDPIPQAWRGAQRLLRSMTKTGTEVVNPQTGDRGFYRNHRYTTGAKALSDDGVPILPLAGGNIIKLGSPT
jgi:hypothetical protein